MGRRARGSIAWTLIALGVLAGCSSEPGPAAAPGPATSMLNGVAVSWTRLPDPPLTPRTAAIAAALDDRFLVLGGNDGRQYCDEGSDCGGTPASFVDGAAFDPKRQRWAHVADAPVALIDSDPFTTAGGLLYVLVVRAGPEPTNADELLTYDPVDDAWSRHPSPHVRHRYARLEARAERVVVIGGTKDRPNDEIFDPRTGAWKVQPGRSPARTPPLPAAASEPGGWGVQALGDPLSAWNGWLWDSRSGQWARTPAPQGGPRRPGAAAWVGRSLFVSGGRRSDRGSGPGDLDNSAWVLHTTGASVAGGLAWERLPDPPLTPRWQAIAVGLADRFVILGGDEGACPRNADCAPPADPPRRDGAAYNPTLRSWAAIAEAPRGLRSLQTHAVVGNVLYVLLKDDLLAYDGVADAWTRPPGPPAGHRGGRLVDLGGRPAVIAEERRTEEAAADAVYDPTSRSWTKLPADPLGPSFDRVLTDTPAGAVLTGKKLVPQPGSAEPAIVCAALLSRDLQTWKRLPDSDLIGGSTWSWTGKRMIDPSLGSADGGEVDGWGRSVPYGGSFDPVTRTWYRLLNAPEQAAERNAWPVDALGGPVSARDGYLHDDRTGTWDRITRPDGAPPYPGSAAWLGDTLFVLGGQFDSAGGPQRLSGSAWSLTVGTA